MPSASDRSPKVHCPVKDVSNIQDHKPYNIISTTKFCRSAEKEMIEDFSTFGKNDTYLPETSPYYVKDR